MSLLQPFPTLAQSRPDGGGGASAENRNGQADPRTPEEVCAEAMIFDTLACELHILSLEKGEEADRLAPQDAGQAAPETATPSDRPAAAPDADTNGEKAEVREETETRQADATDDEAEARDESESESEATAAAAAEVGDALSEDAVTEPSRQSRLAVVAQDCLAEMVASDETADCADMLTDETNALIATEAEAGADTAAEVVVETVTESSSRSSDEEFRDVTREDREPPGENLRAEADRNSLAPPARDRGLSDLEKAGLLLLGAAAVGAILTSGQRVDSNTGDRVIVIDDDGRYQVLKDDDALLRQPGSEVRTERFGDGSTRATVTREDGTRIVTIRDSAGRALRRVRIEPDGREYLLIDDTRSFEPVVLRDLPRPTYEDVSYQGATDRESLRAALLAAERYDIGRSFSLRQVRDHAEVRALAPVINLEAVTFATNSAAVQPSQAEQLRQVGLLMRDLVSENPTELFLIEGHTDAVGNAGYNLLLSDRRAESVALALSEYFGVPAENMVVQGYGESFLRIAVQEAERLNRRVAVRRITPLVRPN
jgi:outer membrane protein OmpA-like peptidoglycan-associated protein